MFNTSIRLVSRRDVKDFKSFYEKIHTKKKRAVAYTS